LALTGAGRQTPVPATLLVLLTKRKTPPDDPAKVLNGMGAMGNMVFVRK
jgi:hypothetical protein